MWFLFLVCTLKPNEGSQLRYSIASVIRFRWLCPSSVDLHGGSHAPFNQTKTNKINAFDALACVGTIWRLTIWYTRPQGKEEAMFRVRSISIARMATTRPWAATATAHDGQRPMFSSGENSNQTDCCLPTTNQHTTKANTGVACLFISDRRQQSQAVESWLVCPDSVLLRSRPIKHNREYTFNSADRTLFSYKLKFLLRYIRYPSTPWTTLIIFPFSGLVFELQRTRDISVLPAIFTSLLQAAWSYWNLNMSDKKKVCIVGSGNW